MSAVGFIDFHVHAGRFELLRDDIQGLLTKRPMEPGVKVEEVFSRPAACEAYLRERGAGRAIILAECGPGTNFTIDSEMIVSFCAGRPFFIPFGNINPNHHDVSRELTHSLELGVRGFKFYPADHSFEPMIPAMMDVYRECERQRLPIMFHTGLTAQRDAEQKYIAPAEFIPIIEAFPDLVIILAHAGKPHWHQSAIEVALRYENVYLDTALVDPEVLARGELAAGEVRHKILFGSDWPVCGSYSQVRGGFVNALTPAALDAISSANPRRILERMGV